MECRTVEIGLKYQALNPDIEYRRYMRPLAQLVDWVVNASCYDNTLEEVLSFENIEDFCTFVNSDTRREHSRASLSNIRTTLRRIGEAVNPAWGGPQVYVRRYPKSKGTQPYTRDDIGHIVDWAYGNGGFVAAERYPQ